MTLRSKPRIRAGARSYEQWRRKLLSDPKTRAIYEQEAAKKELWLQLVEARQAAGLTQAQLGKRLGVSQAQVARIEKRGYDSYTLKTLRRYVEALGGSLEITATFPEGRVAITNFGDLATPAPQKRHRKKAA